MNGRLLTRRTLPMLVAALSLGAVGTANASTASVDASNGQLVITGTAGEDNIITIERLVDEPRSDGQTSHVYLVHDSNGQKPSDYPTNFPNNNPLPIQLIPGAGCVIVNSSTVRCSGLLTEDGEIKSIKADLNEGFDYFSPTSPVDSRVAPITVLGGANSDFLKGGANGDTLNGEAGDDTIQGFGGDDVIQPGVGANSLYGSSRDFGLDGGAAHDRVDYSTVAINGAANGVYVNINGSADDGIDCFHEIGSPAPTACDSIASDIEDVTGTEGRDIIITQPGDVKNDIKVLGGDNVVHAGAGDDNVTTVNGSTTGNGKNKFFGDDGADTLTAGSGADEMHGGAGGDTIKPGEGDDDVFGDDGADSIDTAGGNDEIFGGEGAETQILAGAGNDIVRGGGGADTNMDGGAGADTLSYDDKTDPVFAALNESNGSFGTFCGDRGTPAQCERDTIKADTFENLQGGSAGDTLIGSAVVNTIEGNAGDDRLEGLAQNDVLIGGADNDTLVGGAGADELRGGTGEGDFVSYDDRTGNVRVTLDGQKNDGENCPSTCENDNLFPDIENIRGGSGNDYLEGADPDNAQSISGNNRLEGLGGNDTLNGKLGSDVMSGGLGTDLVTYAGRVENIRVSLDGIQDDGSSSDPSSAAASTENDQVLTDVENATTGSGNDVLIGSGETNVLNGSAGADSLDGRMGADTMYGGADIDQVEYTGRNADTIVVASLNDTRDDGQADAAGVSTELDLIGADVENLVGGAEQDYFEGSPQPNILTGGAGNDRLSGGARHDVLLGGDGTDVLHGDSEADTLDGGAGADDMHGDGGDDTVDYSSRTAPITVTFDDVADDGEAGEGDNARRSIENYAPAPAPAPAPAAPAAQPDPAPAAQPTDAAAQPKTETPQTLTSSSEETKTQTVNTPAAQKQSSSTFASAKLLSARKVLVRGKILVKARNGLAQSSAACKGGGNVVVTLTKAGKVVGKKLVKLSRTCSFRAPVSLAKGTTGKLKVEVKFLGNGALKASKRTTKLQVNG